MTPTINDLRDVLAHHDESARVPADLAHRASRAGKLVQRRRVAVGGCVAAVVLAAAAAILVPQLNQNSVAPADDTPNVTNADSLPEYMRGGQLLLQHLVTDSKRLNFAFTPTSLTFGFAYSCQNRDLAEGAHSTPAPNVTAVMKINGQPYTGTSCGLHLSTSGDSDMAMTGVDWAAEYGVKVGEPTTVEFGFNKFDRYDGTRFRVGVYNGIPLRDYPFPEPPSQLKQLPPLGVGGNVIITTSGNNGKDVSESTRLDHGLGVSLDTVAPGEVRLYVNDKLVATIRTWDYSEQGYLGFFRLKTLGVAPGESFRLTTVAERFADGGYQLTLADADRRIRPDSYSD
ncbi:MAG TPA: hypothetical protein VMT88_08695 [Actinomycetes bacterium]|nr:hypothetical protein [Actinomycetes bacterium]